MKKILVPLVAICLMTIGGHTYSAEISHQEAYACKVEVRKCMDDIQVVSAKVQKMNEAAEKGAEYSPADITKIQNLIKELNETLDKIKPSK